MRARKLAAPMKAVLGRKKVRRNHLFHLISQHALVLPAIFRFQPCCLQTFMEIKICYPQNICIQYDAKAAHCVYLHRVIAL